jgi:ribonucleoside-triphosphate reductase (thioredoxin)
MEISNKILSDITVYSKYAKYNQELSRRESWEEIVTRNKEMHIKKYPHMEAEIEAVYKLVYDRKVLPSMRSLQFGGKPIELSPNRVYNCAYLPIDDYRAFGETMFLLLGGTGVGYSVQKHHVDKLPEINKPNTSKRRRFLIGDSIEGWADAIKVLMKTYFEGGSTLVFDFSDIRHKGAQLVTSGGKAPGPQPLKECIVKIQGILDSKNTGDKLTSIETHDIVCHIADAVLAGGIRRAALISLFSADDDEMIAAKSGPWWELNPQRGRANNSAVLLRNRVTKEFFMSLWDKIKASGAGEPGIYLNNDKDWGTNPCCFIGDTSIQTDNGTMTIKDIVDSMNSGNACNVKTFNEETGEIEIKPVLAGQLTKENATIVKMTVDEHGIQYSVECTPDHPFFTKNRGWVECKDLTQDDDITIYQSLI